MPPRLRALHFPAPLDWIRVEDVIREARLDQPAISAKAFWNRWPDKDSFLVDVGRVAFSDDPVPHTMALREVLVDADASLSERIQQLTTTVMTELLARPRSYMLGFLAPIMHASPTLQRTIQDSTDADVAGWTAFYQAVTTATGLSWRPGWDAGRCQVVVQSLIDGLLIRHRLVQELPDGSSWDPISTFTDAVMALFASALDLAGDGRTAAQVLDESIAARALAR